MEPGSKWYHVRKQNGKCEALNTLLPPVGVLAVHLRHCNFFRVNERNFVVRFRLTCGDTTKSTSTLPAKKRSRLFVDALYHFHAQVTEISEEQQNKVSIELEEVFGDEKEDAVTVGELNLHIYDFMKQSQSVRGVFPILSAFDFKLVATVELEFCFKYGDFGYGYANQLDFITEDINSIETSLFPRINPVEGRQLDQSGAMSVDFNTYEQLPHLQYFSPDIGIERFLVGSNYRFEGLFHDNDMQVIIDNMNDRITNLHRDAKQLRNRSERLQFLKKLVNGDQKENPYTPFSLNDGAFS